MKILKNSEYERLVKLAAERDIFKMDKEIAIKNWKEALQDYKDTREQLNQATNLRDILSSLSSSVLRYSSNSHCGIPGYNEIEVHLSDKIAKYVPDILGGKDIIKQESTPCVIVNYDWDQKKFNYQEGYTSAKPDRGETYKVVKK